MATTNKKQEPIFIQIDDERVELTGKELEAFLLERENNKRLYEEKIKEQEAQKELIISAYKKLGLTDEEIAAII